MLYLRTKLLVLVFLAAAAAIIPPTITGQATGQTIKEKQREFDFWLGEWDVNLRVRQKDFTWQDQHQAVARIYKILGGKAVLELWSEDDTGINGYSLRYYNPKKGKWDLWLNWASNSRSATSGMECTFRHKRAECFSRRKISEATEMISRYTFSDAHENSVRWDDAYSQDEGNTWSNNWIMEFTRRSKTAPEFDSTPQLLTQFRGNRCVTAPFSEIKKITANHQNNSRLKIYGILDGCIAIGFLNDEKTNAFFTLTYNTFANAYEFAFLDDGDSTALGLYYGTRTADGFSFETAAVKGQKPSGASIKSGQTISLIKLKYEGKTREFKF